MAKLSLTYTSVEVSFRRTTSGAPCCLQLDASRDTQEQSSDATLAFVREGDEICVSLMANASIVPEAGSLALTHEFARGEARLMNGYQTWTDTVWRDAQASMRGLQGVPKWLVERFALDGSGDYRFTPYVNKPGHQHGWTYACLRDASAAEYALIASLDESQGFLLLRADAQAHTFTLCPEVAQKPMTPGEKRVLLRATVLYGSTEDEVFDRWFSLLGCKTRASAPLVGYSSWYRHYDKIDQAAILSDLVGVKDAFLMLDTLGLDARALRVFQIDDGWCCVGDWLSPHQEKFPLGMRYPAEQIRRAGFVPGLWLSPFVCSRDSALFAQHPDWILRDSEGELQSTGSHWNGAFALDIMNPEVQAYVRECLDTVVRQWGFGLVKLDFLYGACLLPPEGHTRGELMSEAMQLIRQTVGKDCLIDACGVPLAPAFGVADYCRIGCDVGPDWDDKFYMRPLHRERVSTKNAIGNIIGRAPLDGRAFGNDPDVIFLRQDVKLTASQKAQLLDAASRHGSMLLTSDDMAAWSHDDLKAYCDAANLMCARVCDRRKGRSGE